MISCSTSGLFQSPLDKLAITAFGQRVFRCPAPPLRYWSLKCNVELFHLQRCFSTQYKIPHHPSPPANQSTSSRSRRNKASPSPTAPTAHPPIYNVVSRPFAINLVASPAAVALRPFLEKIKRYRIVLFMFFFILNKKESWSWLTERSLIYFMKKSVLEIFRRFLKKKKQSNFYAIPTVHLSRSMERSAT